MNDKDDDVPYIRSERYQLHRYIFGCVGSAGAAIVFYTQGDAVGAIFLLIAAALLGFFAYAYKKDMKDD